MTMQSIDQQGDNMQQLQLLYAAQFTLDTMAKNLALIQLPTNTQTTTQQGGDLFAVAAQYYGDATYWQQIADANGLLDPELPDGLITLLIPPKSTNAPGAVLDNQ